MLTRHVKIVCLIEALFLPSLLTQRDNPLPQSVLQGMDILPDTAQPVPILHGPNAIHDPVNDDGLIGIRIRTRLRQLDLVRSHTHKITFLAIGKGSAQRKLQKMYYGLRLNEAINWKWILARGSSGDPARHVDSNLPISSSWFSMCTLVSTLFIDTLLMFVCEYGRVLLAILSLYCKLRFDLRGMPQKGVMEF
jgi:hypothetical protein